MYTKAIIILALIVALAIVISKVMTMRRELPFQEIIPLDGAVAVANTQNWYNNSLDITLKSDSDPIQSRSYNSSGFCIFNGLKNGKKYNIEIERTDLKGMLLYKRLTREITPRAGDTKYLVLIGASVGKAWNFPQLVNRYELGENVVLGYRCKYDFDKSAELNILFKAPFQVSGIIIKECSAYFPRERKPSEEMIKLWVKAIRSHGIVPILATVVPVTKERDKTSPGKFRSILEFNDFIRDYAAEEHLHILDLERAVRISDIDRHLREEYAQPDGSHLVKKAYNEALDKIAVQLIREFTD